MRGVGPCTLPAPFQVRDTLSRLVSWAREKAREVCPVRTREGCKSPPNRPDSRSGCACKPFRNSVPYTVSVPGTDGEWHPRGVPFSSPSPSRPVRSRA